MHTAGIHMDTAVTKPRLLTFSGVPRSRSTKHATSGSTTPTDHRTRPIVRRDAPATISPPEPCSNAGRVDSPTCARPQPSSTPTAGLDLSLRGVLGYSPTAPSEQSRPLSSRCTVDLQGPKLSSTPRVASAALAASAASHHPPSAPPAKEPHTLPTRTIFAAARCFAT